MTIADGHHRYETALEYRRDHEARRSYAALNSWQARAAQLETILVQSRTPNATAPL